MQLSSDFKKSVQCKQCSCYSIELKCMSECQITVTLELPVQWQNDIENRFDNNKVDKVFLCSLMSLWFKKLMISY